MKHIRNDKFQCKHHYNDDCSFPHTKTQLCIYFHEWQLNACHANPRKYLKICGKQDFDPKKLGRSFSSITLTTVAKGR